MKKSNQTKGKAPDQAAKEQQKPKSRTSSAKNVSQKKAGISTVNTPDEESFSFYNGSFTKLLEHDVNTGLLTAAGKQNYERLKTGLKLNDPESGFNQSVLNSVQLAVPIEIDPAIGKPKPRRLFINPQSSKALTVNGEKTSDVKSHKVISQYYSEVNQFNQGDRFYYSPANYPNTKDLLNDLSFLSSVTAAETLEVYIMSLLRDVEFVDYDLANAEIKLAVDALNEFDAGLAEKYKLKAPKENTATSGTPNYQVTLKTLLRGSSPGDLKGDYLSKFFELLRPPLFPSGCAPHVGELIGADIFYPRFGRPLDVPKANPKREWCLTFNDFVTVQNGKILPSMKYDRADFKGGNKDRVLVTNGRHLSTLVHTDGFYEEFLWAVDVLAAGNYKRAKTSIYSDPSQAPNEGDGPTLGIPNAASLVGAVALDAGRLAWRQKWIVARRGRPEVMGGLIHKLRETGNTTTYGKIDAKLLRADTNTSKIAKVFEKIKARNKSLGGASASTYLLSQTFPEASPSHPAWTSGHATIAGACVTVVKAIFDDLQPLKKNDGSVYRDHEKQPLLVGRELDKLASNVAFGRNFGGVHFRSDGEHGIILGEEIAIRFLQQHLGTYKEKFRDNQKPHFILTKRSGRRIKITESNVTTYTGTMPTAKKTANKRLTFAADVETLDAGEGTVVL